MEGIDLMVREHEYITRMLKVVRRACMQIMNGRDINYDDFGQIIGFIREYADKHHHNKEEKLLFTRMVEEGGDTAVKLVKHGMLVEHDLGRMYVRDLEDSLSRVKSGDNEAKVDVIANAISYTHLLEKHIEKENNAAYTYAVRQLPEETLRKIDEECKAYESESAKDHVQDRYIGILKELENKYIK